MNFVESESGLKIPQHVRDLPKAELIRRIHGIHCGSYACISCGVVYVEQDYPSSQCVHCLCPLPQVCVNKTCLNVVEPMKVTTEAGKTLWYPPTLDCGECQKFTGRKQRAAYIDSITPAHIAAHLGTSYEWNRDGRGPMDEILKGWFTAEQCGSLSGVTMLYVWGESGAGKSVGVMYHAAQNHLCLRIKGLFYVSEDQLINANADRYADSFEAKERASYIFQKCSATPLLIVDGFGDRSAYRPAQAEMYSRTLGERIRNAKPTIVIGRKQPKNGTPFEWIPGQVSGAFRSSGRSVWVEAS